MQKPAPQGMRRTRKHRRTLNTRDTGFSLLCNEKSPAEQVLAALGLGTALQRCDVALEFLMSYFNCALTPKEIIGLNY